MDPLKRFEEERIAPMLVNPGRGCSWIEFSRYIRAVSPLSLRLRKLLF